MNQNDLTSKFLDSFQSKNTKSSYKSALNDFFRFVSKSLDKISDKDILNYYEYLNNKNDYKKQTKELKFNAVRSFFNYLKIEKIKNNKLKLNNINLDYKLKWKSDSEIFNRDILTIDEIKLVLNYLKRYNFRFYLVFFILADTGMRVNGLVNIQISNIDLENRKIIVYEKGKIRVYTFGNNLKRELVKYIQMRSIIQTNHNFLLINKRKNRERETNVHRIFIKINEIMTNELNINKKITAHCLRASFKTNRRDLGQNDSDIEFFLQHNHDYRTTYLRYTDEQRLRKFDEFEML